MSDIRDFSPLWDKWEITEKIGSGLYGTVYKIKTVENGKDVFGTVKHISVDAPDNSKEIEEMFEGTAPQTDSESQSDDGDELSPKEKALNQILDEIETNYSFSRSKNLLIYEEHSVFEKENQQGYDIFIRMPYLESLDEILTKEQLSDKEKLKLACDICSALSDLEKRGVPHGDIKPKNIFRNQNGDYLLADFGIAKKPDNVINNKSVKDTVAFMAPELQGNRGVKNTADIYSLGMLLYKLFNNNNEPFVTEDSTAEEKSEAILKRIKGVPFPSPCNADPELAKVILIACQFAPGARWMDASSFKNALLSYRPGSTSQTGAAGVAGAAGIAMTAAEAQESENSGDIFTDSSDSDVQETDDILLSTDDVDAFKDIDEPEAGEIQDINSQATIAFTPQKDNFDDEFDDEEYYAEDDDMKPKGKGKTALIIVAILLVLVIIGGAVFFAISSGMFGEVLPGASGDEAKQSSAVEETTEQPTPPPLTTAPPTEKPTEPPKSVIVPYVTGMDYSLAMDEFEYAGLSVSIDYYDYSDDYAYNTVISVNPGEGESVEPGSTVSIVISLGKEDQESQTSSKTNDGSNEKTGGYILDGSDSRYIDKAELENMDETTMTLALNELYARHGRIFTTPYISEYFNSKSWYNGTVSPDDFSESVFNTYEVSNKNTIVSVMESRGYR